MDTLVRPARHFLRPPRTVGFKHVMTLVTEHREGKVVFLGESSLPGRRISAYTDYFDSTLPEFLEFITEFLALGGSAGSTGLGEKP